MFFSLVLSTDN